MNPVVTELGGMNAERLSAQHRVADTAARDSGARLVASLALDGDFASGLRRQVIEIAVRGDFAMGTRSTSNAVTLGDFATGMRARPVAITARVDFARGQRSLRASESGRVEQPMRRSVSPLRHGAVTTAEPARS
jgi:hypothetical protein